VSTLVALSEADAENWAPPLLEQVTTAKLGLANSTSPYSVPDYMEVHKIRQPQRRFFRDEVDLLVAAYEGGATTYDLALEFKCQRHSVSRWLKIRKVQIRTQRKPPLATQETATILKDPR
jgi:hypothetical protein